MRENFKYFFKENVDKINALIETGGFETAVSIEIGNLPKLDLSFISQLTKLRHLSLGCLSSSHLDLSKLANLESLELHEKSLRSISGFEKLKNLRDVALHSPTSDQLESYAGRGQNLVIYSAPTVIPNLRLASELKRIKIVRSLKGPVDVGNLGSVANLEDLSFNDMHKGIQNCSSLCLLENLRYLMFWNVKQIDSKDWILSLPKLENVSFWGTNDVAEEEMNTFRVRGLTN